MGLFRYEPLAWRSPTCYLRHFVCVRTYALDRKENMVANFLRMFGSTWRPKYSGHIEHAKNITHFLAVIIKKKKHKPYHLHHQLMMRLVHKWEFHLWPLPL